MNFNLSSVVFLTVCSVVFTSSTSFTSKSKNNNKNCKCKTNEYDYIIIGSGTAGSILASELSTDTKNRVLLVEEGGWSNEWDIVKDASVFFEITSEPQITRNYFTQPEKYINNRTISTARAKMTGGCGNHNGMTYILGNIKDFNQRWQINDWYWNDISEIWDYINSTFITTFANPLDDPFVDLFIQSGIENGYKYNPNPNDLNNNGQGGVSRRRFMANKISKNFAIRTSSWNAYTEPILTRDNLDVMVYTRVEKILFKTHKKITAIGIKTFGINTRKNQYFYAQKEVILAAGVFNSPQILMLSGIGDCNYLRALNIDCIKHLPGVGQSLEDHLLTLLFSPPLLDQNVSKYLDIPFIFSGVMAFDNDGNYANGLSLFTVNNQIMFFVMSSLFHYESRGYVKLRDNNPESDPIIVYNYLSTENDRQRYIQNIKEARKLMYAPTLLPLYTSIQHEILPGFGVQTDEEILEFGKEFVQSDNHPCCTCKMGNNFKDPMIVVNNRLQVKGIKNLRIIDGSIMPEQISGNSNQITMIIGFKGAQMVLEDNK